MKKAWAWFPAFAGMTLLLSSCGSDRLKVGKTANGETIEAEGICPIVNNDIKGAKTCALVEAQKQALERVIGVYISAKTRVEKAVTIEQNILANTQGYISKYDILKEKRDGEFFKTKIRAMVLFNQLGEDLRGLDVIKNPAIGNPRIAVIIGDFEGSDEESASTHASNGVMETLNAAGYRIVDPEAVVAAKAYEAIDQIEGDGKEVIDRLATKLRAEIIIYGEARTAPIDLQGVSLGGMKSWRANLSARVSKAYTGDLLAVVNAQASGLDVTEDAAMRKSLENAGRKAGDQISQTLSQKLMKSANVEITAKVSGMDKVKAIREMLSATPGVDDVYLRSLLQNTAVIEVIFNKSGRTSAGDLADRLQEKLGASIDSIEDNTLTVTIR